MKTRQLTLPQHDCQGLTVLILASIWPEVQASAASTRLLTLIAAWQEAGATVVCSADARETAATASLRAQGVACHRLAPNDAAFDRFVADLKPDLTLFDRYTTEEKFGWRLRLHWPQSLRILDTIDIHALRQARGAYLRLNPSDERVAVVPWASLADLAGDVAWREVAAIYRSDVSLITSDAEMQLLTDACGVPASLLLLCRLTYLERPAATVLSKRRGFATIGHFRHGPNADGVLWLRQTLWPRIRQQLPDAIVEIWGAGCGSQHSALESKELGFFVRGYATDPGQALASCRINLAPLRYGAGIKGKIADGWWYGTPAVTTPIGAEGMHETLEFGGLVASDADSLVAAAVRLYRDDQAWHAAAAAGARLLSQLYSPSATTHNLLECCQELQTHREPRRRANFTGQMLWQQGLRSTEYFSRWIATKQAAGRSQEPGAMLSPKG